MRKRKLGSNSRVGILPTGITGAEQRRGEHGVGLSVSLCFTGVLEVQLWKSSPKSYSPKFLGLMLFLLGIASPPVLSRMPIFPVLSVPSAPVPMRVFGPDVHLPVLKGPPLFYAPLRRALSGPRLSLPKALDGAQWALKELLLELHEQTQAFH